MMQNTTRSNAEAKIRELKYVITRRLPLIFNDENNLIAEKTVNRQKESKNIVF
jgi:hypothetical protein